MLVNFAQVLLGRLGVTGNPAFSPMRHAKARRELNPKASRGTKRSQVLSGGTGVGEMLVKFAQALLGRLG